MKKLNYFFVLSILLLTGCAYNRASFQDYPVQTEVQLNQANFRVVGTVFGYSRQVYVFGIGGLSKKSLKENAIMDMYEKAHLTGSQAIVNVTTAFTVSTVLGIYSAQRAVSRGTIIEFLDASGNPVSSLVREATPAIYTIKSQELQKTDAPQAVASAQQTESFPKGEALKQIAPEQLDADQYYIAWLYKTRNLNSEEIIKLSKIYDMEAIKKLAPKYTEAELKKRSAGHDSSLEKYAGNKK